MVALAAAAVGCGGAARSGADATTQGFDEAAVIAAADRADGREDHVVGTCAVCELAMEGSPEFASSHAGYTFHLCSAHCKETFDHDPTAVLRRLAGKRG